MRACHNRRRLVVDLASETTDELTALIRSKSDDQVLSLRLVRKSNTRSVSSEIKLHGKATASEHVVTLHQRGASSTKVYFVISEHCEGTLRSRITRGEGVRDDELFWRWSTQIARGVVDVHRAGIIHLAIEPRNIALTDTDGTRIGEFHSACSGAR